MKEKKKLNVGSGDDIRKDFINLDFHDEFGADLIFNLDELYEKNPNQIPLKDGSMDYIYCSHVLEHFQEPIVILNEFVRLARKGGNIEIRVPYLNEHWNSIDHRKPFTLTALRSFATSEDPRYRNRLKVVKEEFYPAKSGKLSYFVKSTIAKTFNLIGINAVEKSFIKYLVPSGIYIRTVYKKI